MYEYSAKLIHVVDGDTQDYLINLGFNITFKIRVRLLGIDTSEIFHPTCSEERIDGFKAKKFVFDNFFNKVGILKTYKDDKGKYGRFLADFQLKNGSWIVQSLIQAGYQKPKKWIKKSK